MSGADKQHANFDPVSKHWVTKAAHYDIVENYIIIYCFIEYKSFFSICSFWQHY